VDPKETADSATPAKKKPAPFLGSSKDWTKEQWREYRKLLATRREVHALLARGPSDDAIRATMAVLVDIIHRDLAAMALEARMSVSEVEQRSAELNLGELEREALLAAISGRAKRVESYARALKAVVDVRPMLVPRAIDVGQASADVDEGQLLAIASGKET